MNKAVEICRSVTPLREVHGRWIAGYGRALGRMPVHEQKVWMELVGMVGGPVRSPCSPMTEEARERLRADLEATGLIAKLSQSNPIPLRQAV
jgi:dihydrodipicolinate synthase/N-acetylneuraminate lyase